MTTKEALSATAPPSDSALADLPSVAQNRGGGSDDAANQGTAEVDDLQRLSDAVNTLRIKDEVRSSTSKSSEEAKTPASTSEVSSRKPASLDGKSTTSGTTFALDEKESLRPDDSASVMAAEEDDTFSAPGSIVAGSRMGSETGARAFRDQFHEISERMGYPPPRGPAAARPIPPTLPVMAPQVVGTSQAGAVAGQTVPTTLDTSTPNGSLPFGFSQSEPDEKLLEALESPKDRLFLLRLEQDVIEFVKDSK